MAEEFNPNIVYNQHVLFLGAGASAPLGLRPTAPFIQHLQERLPDLLNESLGNSPPGSQLRTLFAQAARHYRAGAPDSEYVLDYLEFLIGVCKNLQALP